MKRLIRWLLYLILFVALAVGLLFTLAQVNEEKIRRSLNEELAKSINGKIQIGGLHFTLADPFPRIFHCVE